MGQTLDSFTIKRAGRTGEEIDFEPYFDGKVHELKEGADFKVKVGTFRGKAASAARAKGGSLETRVDKSKGLIQIQYNKNGKPKTAAKK